MDAYTQKMFIKELTDNISASIIKKIEQGKIPEDWDGIELRWMVQDYAATNFGKLEKKRKREYKNTIMVNGI